MNARVVLYGMVVGVCIVLGLLVYNAYHKPAPGIGTSVPVVSGQP
jgi:hypothetical protein